MTPSAQNPADQSNLLGAFPSAAMNVGLSLLSRRASAMADFWRSVAEVRQPAELMVVQASYLTHMLEDYGEAFSETAHQINRAPEAAPQADASAQGAQAAA